MRLKVQERKRTQNSILCTRCNCDKGLKNLPTYCHIQYSPQESPVLSGCDYSSFLSQEWGRTVPSPGMWLSAPFVGGMGPGVPNSGTHTVQQPGCGIAMQAPSCSPTPPAQQLQGKDCALCSALGWNNHKKINAFFLYTLLTGKCGWGFLYNTILKGWGGTTGFSQPCELPSESSTSKRKGQVTPQQQADHPGEARRCLLTDPAGIWDCL